MLPLFLIVFEEPPTGILRNARTLIDLHSRAVTPQQAPEMVARLRVQNGTSSSSAGRGVSSSDAPVSLRPPTNWTRSATTSCLLRFWPSWVSHDRCCSRPSTSTCRPLLRYSAQVCACLSQTTTVMKQASSLRSPALVVKERLTATSKLHTAMPAGVCRSSGSLVRFPSRITLLKLAITDLLDGCRGSFPTPRRLRL